MPKNKLLESQLGFYYGTKINNNKSFYNIAEYIEIRHPLAVPQMKHAIHCVISQAPTLNVLFAEENGTPYQYPATINVSLEWVDLTKQADGMASAIALMEADAGLPFSLDTAPLYRQKIIKLGEKHFLWYFCSHHLLLDGYGTYLLFHQVAQTYQCLLQRQQDTPQPTIEALLHAESEYKQSAAYQVDRQFWQVTSNLLPKPTTLACTNIPSGHTSRHVAYLPYPADLLTKQSAQPSWLARTFAAVIAYLYLCTGEKQQIIGVPMMARTDHNARQALICKTNVIPLALDIDETASCQHLAQTIESKLKQLKKHQAFRYEEIKSLRGIANCSPLFNIVVNVIPFEAATSFSPTQRSVIRNLRSGGAQDLVLNIRPDIDNRAFRMEIDADSGLYDSASLVRHSQAIQKLCSLLYAESENLSINKLRRHFPLSLQGKECSDDVVDIMQRIEYIAAQTPQHIAILTPAHVSSSVRTISYSNLFQQVSALAETLAFACSPNTVLLLDLPQGPEAIICMLAALQLRIPFVNLNTSNDETEYYRLPEQFSKAILFTAQQLTAVHSELAPFVQWGILKLDIPAGFSHFTVYHYQKIADTHTLPTGTSYVMFTSGSTGTSKGVICTRHSLNVFIDAAIKCYGLQVCDRVLQFAPLHFDASIEEVFMTLAAGARLYIAPKTVKLNFSDFFTFCATHQISLLDLPTAYFNEMLFALNGKRALPPTITTVIIGGESLSSQARKRWFTHYPDGIRLFNSYGPTEATVVATVAEIKNDDTPVTIGIPLDGIFTAIVGENLMPLPLGCSGELLIAGATVSQGYLHQPTLSAEKFVTIDVNGYPMSAYRTGDIACQRHDGQLLFLGRKVRETKIAGQRVNMNEIECCIARLPSIVEIAVLEKSGDAGTVLYAHYHSQWPLSDAERRTLYGILPSSHIPQNFIHHQTPLTKLANGKIDYRTLERQSQVSEPKRAFPSTIFNALTQEVWLDTLGSDDSDFFTLGGESLQAIKIINTLNTYCQLDLNLRDLFEHPRPADFCQHLVRQAHSRYGLDQHHLDIRCAIGRCLSTNTPADSMLFIQSPNATDERLLLAALANKNNVSILLSQQELLSHTELTLSAAIFNVPDDTSQYASWLDSLPPLLSPLFGRVHQMIFLHNAASGIKITQELLHNYQHKKLILLRKEGSRLQAVNAGITELITLSAHLGYFPHIQFDTANEQLASYVLKLLGLNDTESTNHLTAFAVAQQKNPGVQLCDLPHWLNLVSTYNGKCPSKSGKPSRTIGVSMEGANQ